MPEFKVDARVFSKMIDFCNKLTGSEREKKFIRLYYDNGLKLFSTDGCLSAVFSLKQKCEPFTGVYELPIKTLRLLIEKKRENDLYLALKKGEITLKIKNELLTIATNTSKKIPPSPVFEMVGKFSVSSFFNGLDFATVHMPEDDKVFFFVKDGILYIISIYDNVFCIYNTGTQCNDIESAVPYQSVRHLIKAQKSVKSCSLNMGINQEGTSVGFQTSGLLTKICSRPVENYESERILKLIHLYHETVPVSVLDKNGMKHDITKTQRISPRTPIKARLTPDALKLELKTTGLYYSCYRGINEYTAEEAGISFKFYGKYLKSALSRLNRKAITIFRKDEFYGIGDEDRERMIIIANLEVL